MSPDGSKTVSPEERLLRLIRGKGRPSPPALASEAPATSAVQASARPAGGRVRRPAAGADAWLGWLNVILIGLVVVELALLVVVWLQPPALPPELPPERGAADGGSGSGETPDALAALAGTPSLAASAARPLFHAEAFQAVRPTGPGTMASPSEDAKAMASRLSLIGIVAGDPPQAIIEDSQTRKTYFVAQGQTLIGELVISEVKENRAILEFRGEKIELSL